MCKDKQIWSCKDKLFEAWNFYNYAGFNMESCQSQVIFPVKVFPSETSQM